MARTTQSLNILRPLQLLKAYFYLNGVKYVAKQKEKTTTVSLGLP